MKKYFLILSINLLSIITIQAHKLGDYIEFDGIPAFVFYVDDTGEHGLAMSMPAAYTDQLKKIDKYVKKGFVPDKMSQLALNGLTIDIESYSKAGMLKSKNKEKFFTPLIPRLSEKGEENAIAIEAYCKEQNISMQEYFPWQYWATKLGAGWFIPGDSELELFAQYYVGGLNKQHRIGLPFITKSRGKELSHDERVQLALTSIAVKGGLISSTAKHADCGFRTLSRIQRSMPKPEYWYELLDIINGSIKELTVQTCAVHKF